MTLSGTRPVYVAPRFSAPISVSELLRAGKGPCSEDLIAFPPGRLAYGILHKDPDLELNYCKRLIVTARLMGATAVGLEKNQGSSDVDFFDHLEQLAVELGMRVVYLIRDETLTHLIRIMVLDHLLKQHRDCPLEIPVLEPAIANLEQEPEKNGEHFIWGLQWACERLRQGEDLFEAHAHFFASGLDILNGDITSAVSEGQPELVFMGVFHGRALAAPLGYEFMDLAQCDLGSRVASRLLPPPEITGGDYPHLRTCFQEMAEEKWFDMARCALEGLKSIIPNEFWREQFTEPEALQIIDHACGQYPRLFYWSLRASELHNPECRGALDPMKDLDIIRMAHREALSLIRKSLAQAR